MAKQRRSYLASTLGLENNAFTGILEKLLQWELSKPYSAMNSLNPIGL